MASGIIYDPTRISTSVCKEASCFFNKCLLCESVLAPKRPRFNCSAPLFKQCLSSLAVDRKKGGRILDVLDPLCHCPTYIFLLKREGKLMGVCRRMSSLNEETLSEGNHLELIASRLVTIVQSAVQMDNV